MRFLSSRPRRLCFIAVVATVAGMINAVIIFNLTHQFGYAVEVVPVIMAMSEDDKNIIVDSEQEYNWFAAYAKDYIIYMSNNVPDSLERAWFIFSSDNPKKSEDPNDLIPGFHVISEVNNDNYSAFELEKL